MKIPIKCKGNRSMLWSDLLEFQGNLKSLSKENKLKLQRSILKYGWIAPVYVWDGNKILDGHGRLLALKDLINIGKHSIDELPVVDIEAENEKQAAEILLAINSHYQKITEKGIVDFIRGFDLDLEIVKLDFDLPDIDFGKIDIDMNRDGDAVKEDAVPEVQEEAISKIGDLWLMDEHRLFCGDCTIEENVVKLMDGRAADMLFTDPPYGVNIVRPSKNAVAGRIGKGKKFRPIIGDDKPFNPEHLLRYSCDKIIWGGNYFASRLPDTTCWIVWDKRFNMKSNDFADCEIAWTSFKSPARVFKCIWNGWTMEGETSHDGRHHPTQKPIKLFIDILILYTKKAALVLDLYLGSGSTLVACHKIDRTCYGMELSPHYCDVIIKRWQECAGREAVREDGVIFNDLVRESETAK